MNENLELRLREHGFARVEEDLNVFKKDRGIISLLIIERKKRDYKSKRAIEIGLSLNDPFLSNQNDGVVVSVFLSGKGVSSREEGLAIWWEFPKDYDRALAHILRDGFRWFEEFSDIENLIKYFEKGLAHGVSNENPREDVISRLAGKILFRNHPIKENQFVFRQFITIT